MLQAGRHRIRAIAARPRSITHSFSSSSTLLSIPRPNASIELDPSMQALLRDIDISLLNYKSEVPKKRELEVLPVDEVAIANLMVQNEEIELEELSRKSPAALFGSHHIGSVTIPTELQSSINVLIAEADRPRLHEDAKRLFHQESKDDDDNWEAHYTAHYRSRAQADRHADRDGTAFATVALPAHYAAVYSVFSQLKRRLGPDFEVQRVIDWGAGTGTGFWAAGYSFQKHDITEDPREIQHLELANSTVQSYTAIEQRHGLMSIGKRLIRHPETNPIRSNWKKSLSKEGTDTLIEGKNTTALSAFMLTTLQTPLDRKKIVQEMWDSGAHTLVIIDHNTKAGFEAVAEAREYLLRKGRKELETPKVELECPTVGSEDAELEKSTPESQAIRGSHVLAPCPHDGACPLYVPGGVRLVCGFSQRLQRPEFVRKTKHNGVGHEDTEYSYVIIRRGPRPTRAETKVGRVGRVGQAAIAKEDMLRRQEPRELLLHDGHEAPSPEVVPTTDPAAITNEEPQDMVNVEATLRREAYHWPRLVFAPLKKSGHVILDSCTAEGKIVRMTIPKSQGKQPYYDARKSSWGDLFPHDSKKSPLERPGLVKNSFQQGYDIGKRKSSRKPKKRASYSEIAAGIKENRAERKVTYRKQAKEKYD